MAVIHGDAFFRYQQALSLYPPVNPAACMADRFGHSLFIIVVVVVVFVHVVVVLVVVVPVVIVLVLVVLVVVVGWIHSKTMCTKYQ